MESREKKEPVKMRLYSPLMGIFYDSEDNDTTFDGYALKGYDRSIKEAVKQDWIAESRAGLAEYLEEGPLKEKIVRMHPAVDAWNYCLWGVLEVECREALSPEETEQLKREWYGQMTDGWGEGFVQQEIECEEGCKLFVDFGAAARNRIRTEQELKGIRMEEPVQTAGETQDTGQGFPEPGMV